MSLNSPAVQTRRQAPRGIQCHPRPTAGGCSGQKGLISGAASCRRTKFAPGPLSPLPHASPIMHKVGCPPATRPTHWTGAEKWAAGQGGSRLCNDRTRGTEHQTALLRGTRSVTSCKPSSSPRIFTNPANPWTPGQVGLGPTGRAWLLRDSEPPGPVMRQSPGLHPYPVLPQHVTWRESPS